MDSDSAHIQSATEWPIPAQWLVYKLSRPEKTLQHGALNRETRWRQLRLWKESFCDF